MVVNHARWVIVAAVLFVVAAAVLGRNVADKLLGGIEDPQSESVKTAKTSSPAFPGAGEPDFVVLVTARRDSVDDAGGHRRRAALTRLA